MINDGSLTDAQVAQYQSALRHRWLRYGHCDIDLTQSDRRLVPRGYRRARPDDRETVSQLSDQLGSLSSPFPKEPFGIGALADDVECCT